MRICIPVTTNARLDARLNSHFGSAPFYAIAETTTGAVMVVANGDCQHRHGECAPVDHIRGYDIGVLAAVRDNAVTEPNEDDMCKGHGHADHVGT